MTRSRILLIGQWALSIGLLWYLLSNVDLGRAGAAVLKANPWLVLAGFVQLLAQPLLGALRWKLIARALGGSLALWPAIRYFWIGAFFNQALPGSVGGDVIRMWLYRRQGAPRSLSVASVVLERFFMVLCLLLLVLLLQPGLASRGASPSIVLISADVLGCTLAGLAVLIFASGLLARHVHWLALRVLLHLAIAVRRMFSNVGETVVVCGISIVAYLNIVITVWLIALGVGLNVSLLDCLVLFPVVVLVATLPISIGGWGVREGAAISVFALVGVPQPDALALSILFGLAGILVTVPGAGFWMWQGLGHADITKLSEDDIATEPTLNA